MYIALGIYILVLVWGGYCLVKTYMFDRNAYMRVACKRLETTIECMEGNIVNLASEIECVYKCYSNYVPMVKVVYPNVVMWVEDVVYKINSDSIYARKLKPYLKEIKIARDELNERFPFADCDKYQQEILNDLKNLEKVENGIESQIVIKNLIFRIKGEFTKLNLDTKKNNRINKISLIVTILSIFITIYSLLS